MRSFSKRSSRAARYTSTSSPGGRCVTASAQNSSTHARTSGSRIAEATVVCPRPSPVYASSECAPFSSHSLRCSNGAMSSTNRAPARSHSGRPEGKRPLSTQSLKGSVTTGLRSIHPAAATARMSASVVCGVMRSTDVATNATWSCTYVTRSRAPAISASVCSTDRVTSPLSGRLSHGTIASGGASVRRRCSSAASKRASAVVGPSASGMLRARLRRSHAMRLSGVADATVFIA